MNSGSAHSQGVLIFDKTLKRLIYLGYLKTKQYKYLVLEKESKSNMNSVELKSVKLRKILKTLQFKKKILASV